MIYGYSSFILRSFNPNDLPIALKIGGEEVTELRRSSYVFLGIPLTFIKSVFYPLKPILITPVSDYKIENRIQYFHLFGILYRAGFGRLFVKAEFHRPTNWRDQRHSRQIESARAAAKIYRNYRYEQFPQRLPESCPIPGYAGPELFC